MNITIDEIRELILDTMDYMDDDSDACAAIVAEIIRERIAQDQAEYDEAVMAAVDAGQWTCKVPA
jgi:hypothetical protein